MLLKVRRALAILRNALHRLTERLRSCGFSSYEQYSTKCGTVRFATTIKTDIDVAKGSPDLLLQVRHSFFARNLRSAETTYSIRMVIMRRV